MATWLMKSEPDVFSIEDLRRENVAGWEGVRNYQARRNLRAMVLVRNSRLSVQPITPGESRVLLKFLDK